MSGTASLTKKNQQVNFTAIEFAISRIVNLLAHTRLQAFTNAKLARQKATLKRNLLEFVCRFTNYYNFKQIVRSVRDEIPDLFGYEKACLFLKDSSGQNLCVISQDDEADALKRKNGPPGFELEFTIDEAQVVKFPPRMGITGMSLMT